MLGLGSYCKTLAACAVQGCLPTSITVDASVIYIEAIRGVYIFVPWLPQILLGHRWFLYRSRYPLMTYP